MTKKRREKEQQVPRFNQVAFVKLCMITTGLASILLFGAVLFVNPDVRIVAGGQKLSAAEQEIVEILDSLRITWDQRDRTRILGEAQFLQDRYAAALQRILRMQGHPLLEQAVDYAGALGAPSSYQALVSLTKAKDPVIRSKAVLAAERIEPWSTERLDEFLRLGIVPVQLAALRISSKRVDAPWESILGILHGDQPLLREASIQAIPEHPSGELADAIWRMVEFDDAGSVITGLQTIARTSLAVDFEQQLAMRMPMMAPSAQMLCLQILATRGASLRSSLQVWELAQDSTIELVVRAEALRCLEMTQSFDGALLSQHIFMFEPSLQYFAARCLLARGEESGVDVLMELLGGDDPDCDLASRQLLAWLTGHSPGSSREEFELARSGMQLRAPLPAPGIETL